MGDLLGPAQSCLHRAMVAVEFQARGGESVRHDGGRSVQREPTVASMQPFCLCAQAFLPNASRRDAHEASSFHPAVLVAARQRSGPALQAGQAGRGVTVAGRRTITLQPARRNRPRRSQLATNSRANP